MVNMVQIEEPREDSIHTLLEDGNNTSWSSTGSNSSTCTELPLDANGTEYDLDWTEYPPRFSHFLAFAPCVYVCSPSMAQLTHSLTHRSLAMRAISHCSSGTTVSPPTRLCALSWDVLTRSRKSYSVILYTISLARHVRRPKP